MANHAEVAATILQRLRKAAGCTSARSRLSIFYEEVLVSVKIFSWCVEKHHMLSFPNFSVLSQGGRRGKLEGTGEYGSDKTLDFNLKKSKLKSFLAYPIQAEGEGEGSGV